MEIKTKITLETLKHVPFDGLNIKTIEQSCNNLGVATEYVEIYFPDGINDIIKEFSNFISAQMEENLKETDLIAMKVRARIAHMVRLRLELYKPYKSAIRSIMTHFIYPANIGLATKLLWHNVSEIWYLCGDNATDYNYYSKRLLLSGVFTATILYWLEDETDDNNETWRFLNDQISNVLKIGNVKNKLNTFKEKCSNLPFLRLLIRRF